MSYIVKLADLPAKLDSLDLILDKIVEGDCLDLMWRMPDGCVDLVVTDPPYINLTGGYERDFQGGVGKKRTISKCITNPWEATLDWIPPAWQKTKYGMMIFCSFSSIAETRMALPDAKTIALLTWWKRNSAPTGKNVPRYTSEFIWAFNKSPGLKWDLFKDVVIDIPNANPGCMATERIIDSELRAVHPTQKPVALIVELLCVQPSIVFDCFIGTGTTAVAAKKLGRHFIGCEINPDYCKIADERLQDLDAQPELFSPQGAAAVQRPLIAPAESND